MTATIGAFPQRATVLSHVGSAV